ncbi:MAG TPA: DUF3662 and FHA domain-containing protein [Solirubrobacteraceae bacterium]|nr:DUF3662 and FHA domain-containing protein [Solirubrobacteraceae bacterium]
MTNPLRALETRIADLVEGAFGRVFRSEVRPIELAHKLAREMDEHRTASVSRTYAPNEYSIWLSPQDRARYEGVEHEVIEELCAYLLEHARREELILASRPAISFYTDETLSLGEFGIQARLARVEEDEQEGGEAPAGSGAEVPPRGPVSGPPPSPGDEHGQTMVYSSSARMRGAVEEAQAHRQTRALLTVEGRRLALPLRGGVIGRSRDCDVVLEDTGVSRRHAELRPDAEGWTVKDLGSTNGVRVNGHVVRAAHALNPGDRIELGSTEIVFDVS